MKCNQCQSEMVADCGVEVEGDLAGLKIFKKSKGLFNKEKLIKHYTNLNNMEETK
ncbi:MAG TPA: hypothetical protein VLQ66_00545 [Paenisporosarcina sp.]|nr:hypothetical protein [Paenisporosarcina sp.]